MEVMREVTESTKCKKCNQKLTHFIAYIPDLGEVCMKCYIEYAQKMDFQEK